MRHSRVAILRAVRVLQTICLAVGACLAGCGGGSDDDTPRLVATLGDSITAGALRWAPDPEFRASVIRGRPTPASQWQHWAEQELSGEYRFRNCGVWGDRTEQLETRLEQCATDADVLVIQGGTNDITQDRPPAEAATNIREMIRRAQDSGLDVLVTTLPPINARFPEWRAEVDRLNELIGDLASEADVPVIDFFGVLEDPDRADRIRPEWTSDGLHPTIEGYAQIGRAAADELR